MPAPIIVVDYDPQWPIQFARLRAPIADTLGDLAQAIEHVGSTSVPGLAAKPIIDIDVLLSTNDAMLDAIARLATLGYEHEGDLGIAGREAFRHAPNLPVHHLYVCTPDCGEYRRHIAFRDYLRRHREQAEAYGALKRRLAAQFLNDRAGYGVAKDAFVRAILERAMS